MADTTTPTPTFELAHDQASPTPPPRPLRGNSREISSEKMPEQNLANSPNKLAKSASGTSANTMSSLAEQFHSVRSHGMFLLPEYHVAFSQKKYHAYCQTYQNYKQSRQKLGTFLETAVLW